ncbi:MAG: GlpG protein [Candidatus Azotimanducaceae bacterium]|jgi:GlpG protein
MLFRSCVGLVSLLYRFCPSLSGRALMYAPNYRGKLVKLLFYTELNGVSHRDINVDLINALEVPVSINLEAFSQYVASRGIRHRITEEGLNQVIWVVSDEEALQVTTAYRAVSAGTLALPEVGSDLPQLRFLAKLVGNMARFPLTLSLIILSIVLFPVGMSLETGAFRSLLEQMTFLATDEVIGNAYFRTLAETLEAGEYWRLLTPMFLHFSILHVVFNLLWVWDIGRRIELKLGSWTLLLVVIISSLVANFSQYLMTGPVLFGGMSGVVFGLLGFSFVWSKVRPERTMGVPNGIYMFMFVFLAIGFTGILDSLGLGSIANGAHLGGMIGGMLTAGLAVLFLDQRSVHPE